MLKKIWKDPVLSKVISVIIVAIGGLIYARIDSFYKNETVKDSVSNILRFKVELKYILILSVVFFILQWVLKKLLAPKKNINTINIKREKLSNVNKIIDKDAGVMIKWNVYFGADGSPFVAEVKCFCILHESVPIKFLCNKCPTINCKNSYEEINEHAVENMAESIVLDEWDKINGTKL